MRLPVRPLVKPALRQVWRDSATLQLGLESRRAVVLCGLEPSDAQLLSLLDGSRDVATVFSDASDLGCSPERALRVIELLAAADALEDAPPTDPRLTPDLMSLSLLHRGPGAAARVLARRRRARIAVHGAGRVGAGVVALLAAAGVGSLQVNDDGPVRPEDLSPLGIREQGAGSRAIAVTAPLRRSSTALQMSVGATDAVDLAVVAPASSVAPPEVLAAVRRTPHLLVVVRETTAAIGPLVVPALTPCLRCLHLGRAERDPHWGALSAQLAGSGRAAEACDVVLSTLAASFTTMQVLARIDDPAARPPTMGGVLELDLTDGQLRRRSVRPHPSCGCGAADAGATMDT